MLRTSSAAAGVIAVAVGELVATRNDRPSPVDVLGKGLIDVTPGPGIDAVIAAVEHLDKPLLRVQVIAMWPVGSAAAGLPALAALALATGIRTPGAAAAGLVAGAAAGVALKRQPQASSALALAGLGGLLGAELLRRAAERQADAVRSAVELPPADEPLPPAPAGLDVAGLSPLHTPPARFYTTDVSFPAPRVDPSAWQLQVSGLVERPLTLSLADVLSMGLVERDATLVCVHNPVGGPRIGAGRWLGVPVAALLERAGVRRGAEQLVARSVDGFTAGVPLDDAAEALVAVGLNGEPLRVEHGSPARLLTPGLWGADANTKWLCELELTTWDAVSDYWDRRGWPRQPSAVRPGSRIDVPVNRAVVTPGPVVIGGVAWAPPRGVAGVEVAIDDGPWWTADIGQELSPEMWRQWRLDATLEEGEHTIRVRTVARDRTQPAHQAPPYPVGSSGLHEVRVRAGVRRGSDRVAPIIDVARDRIMLATAGVRAWTERGWPPARRWPTPPSR